MRKRRGTRSFRAAGLWDQVLAAKPDYVLIQFGHNDQPGKGPARETDPATTYRDELRRFIDEARAAHAFPILVTSVARRTFEGGKLISTLLPYVEAVHAVSEEKNVPVVDLHRTSFLLFSQRGEKFCQQVSGTSFATAYVAGALALVMEARPDLSAQDAAEVVLKGGRAIGEGAVAGCGLLDVGRAVEAARRRPVLAQAN